MYHKAKYNLSIPNPCEKKPCDHLCLLSVGGDYVCICPDNTKMITSGTEIICDSGDPIRKLID